MATLIDPLCVQDIFIEELAKVEPLGGGCFRFIFSTTQQVQNVPERVVVAKLVAHHCTVPPALFMAARAVGLEWDGEDIALLHLQ